MADRLDLKKNEAYNLSFSMIDEADTDHFKTGETVTDTAYYKDGAGAWTSLAIADTVSEIGSTGMYEIDLTAAELNHDQVIIKLTSTNAIDKEININLRANDLGDFGFTDGAVNAYVDGLTVGAGGISTTATSATVTTGTETLTYASTEELDGTTHDIAPVTGNTEFYYEFNVSVAGIATEIRWDGYAQSNGDSYSIKGYDWVSASWKTIGTVSGTNATSIIERTFVVTRNMTGTGANAGVVRWQVTSSDGTKFATDRIVAEYTASVEAGIILHSGVAQGGSSNTITLDASADSNDDFYNHARIVISSGKGKEQERIIVDYNGTTKVATIAPPWVVQPDSTSAFEVEPGNCHAETGWSTIKVGLIQSATATTAVLDSTASATDDFYNNEILHIDSGTGEGQIRIITDYVGATKTATLHAAWTTTPDATSEYIVEEGHPYLNALLTTVGWDEPFSSHTTNGTFGKLVKNLGEGVVSADSSVNDVSATTTSFVTNLTEAVDNFFNDKVLVFIDGALKGQSKPIQDYNGTTKAVTFDAVDAFTSAPADGDSFIILANHVHPISQIASSVTADIDANSTQLTAIVGDTSELQTDITDGGRIDALIDGIKAVTDALPDSGALTSIAQASALTTVDTVVDGIKAVTDVIPDSGAMTSIAQATALATVDTVADSIKAVTDVLPDAGALTSLAQGAALATVDANVDAILIDTNATIPAQIAALNNVSVNDLLYTQLTESYAAAGAAPTVAQALLIIQQLLGDFSISGTTISVKQVDGVTAAANYTLNDPVNPTGNSRSS